MEIKILEGIDHTGKTTHIDELKQLYKDKLIEIIHVTGEHPNTYDWYSQIINYAKYNNIEYLIFDRGMIGELVYGPIYRNKSRLNMDQIIKLFNECNCHIDIIIRYVNKNDFNEYYDLLSKRDKHGIEDEFTKSKNKVRKYQEQCIFKHLINEIESYKLPNVNINSLKFIPKGGK